MPSGTLRRNDRARHHRAGRRKRAGRVESHYMTDHQQRPRLASGVYIAPTAYVGGDVVIGERSTVMHHVTIRADIAPIRIGARVNIQDGCVVHTPHGTPLDIADDVGIGHRAVIHCRRIERRSLIGIGAILLDGCEIGSECLVAAGALLAPDTRIPDGSVVMGAPGRVVRQVTERDLAIIDHVVASYLEIGRDHARGGFPNILDGAANPRGGGRPDASEA